jgi:hypothetical protein
MAKKNNAEPSTNTQLQSSPMEVRVAKLFLLAGILIWHLRFARFN